MDKETELNIPKKRLEEIQVIHKDYAALLENSIALRKDVGSLSEQIIKTNSGYQLSILTYEADNYIKMIDVCIDILKFLIPTLITIGTVAHIIPQFSGTSIFVFGVSVAFLILLAIAIIIRMKKVKSYVSKFKEEQKKIALEYTDCQKFMVHTVELESDAIKIHNDFLKEKMNLVVGITTTNRP